MARRNYEWKPELPIWQREGDLWLCAREDLLAVIDERKVDEEHMRRRMGEGFRLIALALDGMRLNQHEVNMVEWGIAPVIPLPQGLRSPSLGDSLEVNADDH